MTVTLGAESSHRAGPGLGFLGVARAWLGAVAAVRAISPIIVPTCPGDDLTLARSPVPAPLPANWLPPPPLQGLCPSAAPSGRRQPWPHSSSHSPPLHLPQPPAPARARARAHTPDPDPQPSPAQPRSIDLPIPSIAPRSCWAPSPGAGSALAMIAPNEEKACKN